MNECNSRLNAVVMGNSTRPTSKLSHKATMALAGAMSLVGVSAYAQAPAPAAEPAKPPAAWVDGISQSFWIEGGITFNTDSGDAERNFGRLFDDRVNMPQLNQATYTIQRKIDSSLSDYDIGFKYQMFYGSDARYTHFLHEFQNMFGDHVNQFDIVEANVQVHTPWLTEGGYDIKVGQYPTLEGAETIDPTTNFLYSHSYIFNFGIPLKHTGLITVLHATPMIDIYAGGDTGVNTSVGQGDNNDALSFHGGIGLNLLDGNLTSLATTHIGPENPRGYANGVTLPRGADTKNRYLNDITTIWKVNDKFQLINDLNYIEDECQAVGGNATKCGTARGYGVAQYGVYQLDDIFTLVGRIEIWRDEEGAFAAAFNNNNDFIRFENGVPTQGAIFGGTKTTYGGFTAGVNIKPPVEIPFGGSIIFRPEVRYDASLNDTRPFANNTKKDQFTIASDFILQF
jgi:hypothetical protein